MYVTALTHAKVYIFDISYVDGKNFIPRFRNCFVDNMYLIDFTQTSFYPNLLLGGGLFGMSFYYIGSSGQRLFNPHLVNKQLQPFVNLVNFIPNTSLLINVLDLPSNIASVTEVVYSKSRKKWLVCFAKTNKCCYVQPVPNRSLEIQFGRFPWDSLVVPSSASGKNFQILISNLSEPCVNVLELNLKKKKKSSSEN